MYDNGHNVFVKFIFKTSVSATGVHATKGLPVPLTAHTAQNKMACPFQVKRKDLPQVEEFQYLRVLFLSDGKRDHEIDRRLGQADHGYKWWK